jgi:hypothetical protein
MASINRYGGRHFTKRDVRPAKCGVRRSSQVTEDLTITGESYPTILALRTRAGGTGTVQANMAARERLCGSSAHRSGNSSVTPITQKSQAAEGKESPALVVVFVCIV